MRSKASFKSHPIHPILVSFPIAFFTGTVILDICTLFFNKPELSYTARLLNIAGVVAGFLAAIPGMIDYLHTVPPKSSAKKRATKHALTNVVMLTIFIIAFLLRDHAGISFLIIIAMELVGLILMSVAGWMGGTLVYRNQIGVDIRYADAGKWNEATYPDREIIEVGNNSMLEVNQMKLLHIGGKRIVLARTEQTYTAFDDQCTHKGGSLAGGSMICGVVQCPWHGSQFNTLTGMPACGPATKPIQTYRVEEVNGKLFLHKSIHA
jgi:uncharacterized membrane protein/nitrite reductase/ring-hydroxylating ferredoxin subunit